MVTQDTIKMLWGPEFKGTFTAAASRNGVVVVAMSDKSLLLFRAPDMARPAVSTKLDY